MYYYVTVNEQSGIMHKKGQKIWHFCCIITLESRAILGKGRSISKNKCEGYSCYRSGATALQSLPTRTTSEPSQYFEQTSAVNFESTAREPFVGIINTNLQAVAALSALPSVNCTHSEAVLAKRTTLAKPWRG